MHTKKTVTSELDTNQGEAMKNKFKFAARQLNDEYSCMCQKDQMSIVSYPFLLSLTKT